MALKQFSAANKRLFDQETRVYSKLPNHSSITNFFGAFAHVDILTGERTFSLLLEYGEFDLEEYFRSAKPPQTFQEQQAFWKSLLGVADALQLIHHGFKHNECDTNTRG